jgi:hypothetical protein
VPVARRAIIGPRLAPLARRSGSPADAPLDHAFLLTAAAAAGAGGRLGLVHFDERNDTAYQLDRDSVMRNSDGHFFAMVEKVDLSIEEACEKRNSGSCREDSDPAICDRVSERLCPGGKRENYSEFILFVLTCAGQIKANTYGNLANDWSAAGWALSRRRSKLRSAGNRCRCHPQGTAEQQPV